MDEHEEFEINRRGFLKAAAATAVVAAATGGGAALLKSREASEAVITVAPSVALPAAAPAQGASVGVDPTLALRTQLAELQSENAQLQADLMAMGDRLALEAAVNENAASANDDLQLQLGEVNGRVTLMAGLISLYEQIEEIDVGEMVENGLTAVTNQFDTLTAALPDLDESIAAGRLALSEVEAHIPLLENGRAWLDVQQEKMGMYFNKVEETLKTAVDSVGSFVQMFNEWAQKILKWLPFGLGEKTSNITAALTDLLLETPISINGLDTNIAQPLDAWLGSADEEAPLRRMLITPLRDGVLAGSTAVISQVEQARGMYETEKEKLATAVADQRLIQAAIAQYREENEI